MNVASQPLCKELYELSGWDETTFCYFTNNDGSHRITATTKTSDPAYDLGYLLRKLPVESMVEKTSDGYSSQTTSNNLSTVSHVICDADTPEDAAAKLAIELWKQGVLK